MPFRSYLFIVMEYADKGDLHDMVERQRRAGCRWSESGVLDLFVQLCLALKHLHDRKIVHRDLKPQNVFVTSQGILKLGDLGIARVRQWLVHIHTFTHETRGKEVEECRHCLTHAVPPCRP